MCCKMAKNKVMYYLFFVFLLLNISDVVTTMFILDGEANPIYLLTGKIWLVFLLKAVVVYMLWRFYKKNTYPSNFTYHLLLSIVVYGCLMLFIAQLININGILNPSVVEAAAQTTHTQRAQSYLIFTNLLFLIPIAFTSLVFSLYEKSIKQVNINKDYRKGKKWYQW